MYLISNGENHLLSDWERNFFGGLTHASVKFVN